MRVREHVGVVAGAPVERIDAEAAAQRVVARAPLQRVRGAVAGQRVGGGVADQVEGFRPDHLAVLDRVGQREVEQEELFWTRIVSVPPPATSFTWS